MNQENTRGISYKISLEKELEDGAQYKVQIQVPMEWGWIDQTKFIVSNHYLYHEFPLEYVKKIDGNVLFDAIIQLPTSALYHYYFSYEANHVKHYYKNDSFEDQGKLSVHFSIPDWAKGKMMYHIFVDRFFKGREEDLEEMKNRVIHSNWSEDVKIGPDENGRWNIDFYGGDLKGITKKLDYLESLGIGILYLSPVVFSQSNHRYDTSDYEQIDPYAGNLDDLKELCDTAHQRNIKVILDAVFNHTGNDSKYFNEFSSFSNLGAYQSRESKYYPFFRKWEVGENTYFDYWWGMKNLPVCNGYSIEWQNYIYGEGGIIDLWFSLGIDGLRLDVADELSDEFIEGIRRAVKRNKEDGFILGEVWKNPMRMNRGYIESGKGMDSVMNYPFVNALLRYYKYADVYALQDVLYQLKNEYPEDTLYSLMNFTSTHDITRAINLFSTYEFQEHGEWAWNLRNFDYHWQQEYQISKADYERGKKQYQSYLSALTFFPGNLSIFYGDEVGLQGMGNLANRRTFPWGKEDLELLSSFQKLGQIRKQESFLEKAGLDIVDVNDRFFQYRRVGEREEALVTVNRLDDHVLLPMVSSFEDAYSIYTLGNSNPKELDSYGAIVLKKVKKR